MKRPARLLAALLLALLPVMPALGQSASETDALQLVPVDSSMTTTYVMRNRPFVLPDHLTPAFAFDSIESTPISEDDARADLGRFLELRALPSDRIALALQSYDDPALAVTIPAPNLRAALLMLTDWDPYQVTIDALLSGANESGKPFEAVDFRPLEFGGAVATLQMGYSSGRLRLLVSDRYRNEIPEQLIPVLVHESMHDGVENSFEEEIIASLLDSLAYAEVLAVDPSAANTGTELAAYNNVQLFALMNSIGRRGPEDVGIETSFDGDVYIGDGLERFDADSIRAGIASDPWYSQLPTGGSQGGPVLEALLGRFADGPSLIAPDRFSEEAISVIDDGIGLILTPAGVQALAIDLQLSLTLGSTEPEPTGDLVPAPGLLPSRPFLPSDLSMFDLRYMKPAPQPLDAPFARAALREALLRSGSTSAEISAALDRYDDPALAALVPDPGLRAGLLILAADEQWATVLDETTGVAGDGVSPVHIAFGELPNAVPASWDGQGWGGSPVVWINGMLSGDRPELLATAIAEGLLLESGERCIAQIVIAAALSTSIWAELVANDPDLASAGTWGTISRNRDLLALLNSQPFDPGSPAAAGVGLRLATGSQTDVLPGLLRDAGSFYDYVVRSPRVVSATELTAVDAPPTLTALLSREGIGQDAPNQPARVDEALVTLVDQQFASILPETVAIDAATALQLTLSSSQA